MKFEVIFFEKENGIRPVEDFLNSVDLKMRVKMLSLLEILAEYGSRLREPYSKPLDDGIFELRCKIGTNAARILYFFYYDRKIIITNGFIKRTKKTPIDQLELAKIRRTEYIERAKEIK